MRFEAVDQRLVEICKAVKIGEITIKSVKSKTNETTLKTSHILYHIKVGC